MMNQSVRSRARPSRIKYGRQKSMQEFRVFLMGRSIPLIACRVFLVYCVFALMLALIHNLQTGDSVEDAEPAEVSVEAIVKGRKLRKKPKVTVLELKQKSAALDANLRSIEDDLKGNEKIKNTVESGNGAIHDTLQKGASANNINNFTTSNENQKSMREQMKADGESNVAVNKAHSSHSTDSANGKRVNDNLNDGQDLKSKNGANHMGELDLKLNNQKFESSKSNQHYQWNSPEKGDRPSIILSYMADNEIYDHFVVLLKWDSNGKLERDRIKSSILNSKFQQWLGNHTLDGLEKTKPSPHGSVALFLNTDVVGLHQWKKAPPVPLLSYTIPNKASNMTNVFLLPNPYDSGPYNRWMVEQAQQSTPPFRDKINQIVWRGNLHGDYEKSRVKLLELAKNKSNDDWLNVTTPDKQRLEVQDQVLFRYQIDMAGVSGTTWGALRWKMCSGNLVFKANTWAKDWWHDSIKPWVHYIPVKGDLSNLKEHWEWAESHLDEAEKIAEAGKALCLESVSKENVAAYHRHLMDTLPSASEEIAKEAGDILDGLFGKTKLTVDVRLYSNYSSINASHVDT